MLRIGLQSLAAQTATASITTAEKRNQFEN